MVVVLHKEQVAEGRLGLSWCQDVAKVKSCIRRLFRDGL